MKLIKRLFAGIYFILVAATFPILLPLCSILWVITGVDYLSYAINKIFDVFELINN